MVAFKWPKVKEIKIISVYLETGGKLNELNIQILSDVSQVVGAELFWTGVTTKSTLQPSWSSNGWTRFKVCFELATRR